MAELLDRNFQRELLEKLAGEYPNIPNMRRLFQEDWDSRNADYVTNFHYLYEHGLVTAKFSQPINGPIAIVQAQITARGLDFLADDGGLGAILGTLTVRLHDDTIRQILISRITEAAGDPSLKEKLIAKVKGLPAEALGRVMTISLDKALESAPNLLRILQDSFPQ